MRMKPVDLVLGRFAHYERRNGYYMAPCPAHDDLKPSVSIKEGDDGRALVHCFAGCKITEIVAAIGLEERDLFSDNAALRGGGGAYASEKREHVDTGGASEGCTLAAYADAKALPREFLESLGVGEIANYNGRQAVRIPYLSAEGEEVCVRFRVSLDGSPKIKTRRGDKLALYGLWRLDEARERGFVVAVEGESDAQSCWRHGLPAVGIPGASSWRADWSEHLDGIEKVYVPVEPDRGGEQLWERMTASPIRQRLYRVTLGDCKDVSELHLDYPGLFTERLEEALSDAISFMDSAETEAQEQAGAAWALCEELANGDALLDHFARDLKGYGLAGTPRAAQLVYLALNSRHLDAKQLVNVVVKGPSSAGKTYTVEKVLMFHPEEAYHFLTAMSERALAYSEEPLAHKFLILAEAAGMSGEFQTYLIRSLLSEGRLRYETVERTSDGLKPRLIEREGPTGLVVTTTRTRLHSENETRMLTVTVDDSAEHTREILTMLADEDHEVPNVERWRALQVWISGGERRVTIPYAKALAEEIPPVAVRLRRDFGAMLNLIRSHALLHRATRERDGRGRIVATLDDYAVVRGLVADLISEGVEATVPEVVRETVEKVKKLLDESGERSVNVRQVGAELGLEYQPTYRRVKMAEDAGYLRNLEDRKGKPARLVLGDPMPEDVKILPDPEELRAFAYLELAEWEEAPLPPPTIRGWTSSARRRVALQDLGGRCHPHLRQRRGQTQRQAHLRAYSRADRGDHEKQGRNDPDHVRGRGDALHRHHPVRTPGLRGGPGVLRLDRRGRCCDPLSL
jgi:hypothetical protein